MKKKNSVSSIGGSAGTGSGHRLRRRQRHRRNLFRESLLHLFGEREAKPSHCAGHVADRDRFPEQVAHVPQPGERLHHRLVHGVAGGRAGEGGDQLPGGDGDDGRRPQAVCRHVQALSQQRQAHVR